MSKSRGDKAIIEEKLAVRVDYAVSPRYNATSFFITATEASDKCPVVAG